MEAGKSIFVDYRRWETNLQPSELRYGSVVNAIQSYDDRYEVVFSLPENNSGNVSVYVKDNLVNIFLKSKEESDESSKNNKALRFFRSVSIPPDVDEKMILAIVKVNLLTLKMYKNVDHIYEEIETDKMNIFSKIGKLKEYFVGGFKS